MTKDKELIEGLDELIKLGVLKKVNGQYIDSAYSRKIDKMNPRAAFLQGVDKGYKKAKEEKHGK